MRILKVILWCSGFTLILENFGVNVTSIIAGVGIGGVAVALSVQTVLQDAFHAYVIFLDAPFKVGDLIEFDSNVGTVEIIGFRSTRIRCSSGELLIISNSKLTQAVIRNHKNLSKRRVITCFNVPLKTPGELLRKIPGIVQKVVEEKPLASFGNTNLKNLGDYSFVWELVYFVNSTEWSDYIATRTEITIAIKEQFDRHGIQLCYPTSHILSEQINFSLNWYCKCLLVDVLPSALLPYLQKRNKLYFFPSCFS